MKRIVLFAAIMLITSAGIINAQTRAKSNTARQMSQQARIADGVHDKELTRNETARLEREQRRISIEKRIAKADGTVTPGEKRFLRREQNRASRHIRRQKNDAQVR
jgi:Ni/Co efflux regulator RcnB